MDISAVEFTEKSGALSPEMVSYLQSGNLLLSTKGKETWLDLAREPNWQVWFALNPGAKGEQRLNFNFSNRVKGRREGWEISSKALEGIFYDSQQHILLIQNRWMGRDYSEARKGEGGEKLLAVRVSPEMKDNERTVLSGVLALATGKRNFSLSRREDARRVLQQVLEGSLAEPISKPQKPKPAIKPQKREVSSHKQSFRVEKLPSSKKEGWRTEAGCFIYQEASNSHPKDLQDQTAAISFPQGTKRVAFADGVSLGHHMEGFSGSVSAQEAIRGIKNSPSQPKNLITAIHGLEDGAKNISVRGTGTTLGVLDIIPRGRKERNLYLAQQGTEMVFAVGPEKITLINDPARASVGRVTAALKGDSYLSRQYQNRIEYPLGPEDWVVILTDFASYQQKEVIGRVLSKLPQGTPPEKVGEELIDKFRGIREDGNYDDTTIIFVPPGS